MLAMAATALGVFIGLVAAGERGGDTFWSNPALTVPMLIAVAAAVSAGALGARALIAGDHSAMAWAATLVGLLVAAWVTLELVFPH
jgi:succinate dehydrogenase hydrophobic anchor subunit